MRSSRSCTRLPQHHGQGTRATLTLGVSCRWCHSEVPTGTRLRLGSAARVEHPGCVDQERGRRAVVDFRQAQPARRQLSDRCAAAHEPGRAAAAPAQPARAAGLDPLPDQLLPGDWGFCLTHRHARVAARGRVRGLHRRDARADGSSPRRGGTARRAGGRDPRSARMSATRRLPTTTCRRSRSPHSSRARLPRAHARLTYRFLFDPRTIGAITWLPLNEAAAGRIRHGLVLACSATRAPRLQAQPPWERRRRPRRRVPTVRATARDAPRTSRPTATTSASTARPASTCRSGD